MASYNSPISPDAVAYFTRVLNAPAQADSELVALRNAVEDLAELVRSRDGYVQTVGGLWVPAGRGYGRTPENR